MANLIIKSSADDLVLQGSDASPAITVGTTGTTTFAENATFSGTANNLGTVTAMTLPTASATAVYPAGHVVQTTARVGGAGSDTVTSSPTNGTWYATVVAGSITPIYSNSSIIVNAKWVTRITENTGDNGYGFRFYKSATGITDGYRDGVANWDGVGSVHSAYYRDPLQHTTYVDAYNISWIDDTSEVAGTAVTYTLYHSTYNVDTAIASGGTYEGRWDMFFQEIKR